MTEGGARPPIAAVLLAAGASRRFGGRNKLLMPWGTGDDAPPVLAHVAGVLRKAGVSELVMVTGNANEACRAAVSGLDVRAVHNGGWASGMGGSIAVGIAAVSPEARGALVVPGDMPGLTVDAVRALMAAFEAAGGHTVTVPVTAHGEQRNPVLWPAAEFPVLRALSGDTGAKALLTSAVLSRQDVMIDDPTVFADIDHEAEYIALREALS